MTDATILSCSVLGFHLHLSFKCTLSLSASHQHWCNHYVLPTCCRSSPLLLPWHPLCVQLVLIIEHLAKFHTPSGQQNQPPATLSSSALDISDTVQAQVALFLPPQTVCNPCLTCQSRLSRDSHRCKALTSTPSNHSFAAINLMV